MQTNRKPKPKVEPVKKPVLKGSWHGTDAWRLAGRRAIATLAITVVFLITGMLFSFDNIWFRLFSSGAVLLAVMYYVYAQGMGRGENDAAYAEIMYIRDKEGKQLSQADRDRCFHPFKGLFAALAGAAPFVLIALVFAFLTKPASYALGVLPSWTSSLLEQTEFGDALRYYSLNRGMQIIDVLRILDRAMVMPFINAAGSISDDALLLMERLSPLLVLLTPVGYGLGYRQGLNLRVKINTGIRMGDDKKRRKERKARKQRQRSKSPEQLI